MGQAVGECPTQYLMELGFADQNLDWRAITAEVRSEDLLAAMDGALAMGFRGLRFWGDTQIIASELLGLDGLPVSSAVATESGWKAWHTDGFVLPDLLDSEHGGSGVKSMDRPLSIALFGDTEQTRRIYGGLLNKYAVPDVAERDVQVDWVGVSADVVPAEPRLRTFENESEFIAERSSGDMERLSCLVGCAPQVAQQFASARLTLDDGEAALSSESEDSVMSVSDPVDTGSTGSGPVRWLPSADEVLSRPVEQTSSGAVQRISRVDLMLSGEQFDFGLWTGQAISPVMLRDAFDEFNAF
ncbi:MAG: hypothetical protein Aurels2KO_44230 [Aureliella sp.]